MIKIGPKYSTRKTVVHDIYRPKSLKNKMTSLSYLGRYSDSGLVLSCKGVPLASPTVNLILSVPIFFLPTDTYEVVICIGAY